MAFFHSGTHFNRQSRPARSPFTISLPMTWPGAYQRILPSIFKIFVEDGHATGFLFSYNRSRAQAAIATSAHVVRKTTAWKKPLRLDRHHTGKSVFYGADERSIILHPQGDVALIIVRADSLSLPEDPLPHCALDSRKDIGTKVGWMGFPRVCPEQPCFYSGHISAYEKEKHRYLIDGVAAPGVSGGPVFSCDEKSTQPEIIGVVQGFQFDKPSEPAFGLLAACDIRVMDTHIAWLQRRQTAKQQGR